MKAIKYFCCAALLCMSSVSANDNIFRVDTEQLLINSQYLKPIFENSSIKISFDTFMYKLIQLSIYYDEIISMYKLDRLKDQKSTILLLNKILLPFQQCVREYARMHKQENPNNNPSQELLDKIEQLNANQQLLERIDEVSNQVSSRTRWRRIKIIAICIAVVVAVTVVSVVGFVIYKKITGLFYDEEAEKFEQMEQINSVMQSKLGSVIGDIRKVKNNNTKIGESIIAGTKKVESARDALHQAQRQYEQLANDKKHIIKIGKELEVLKEEIAYLRGSKKVEFENDTLLIKEYRKQQIKIRKLEKTIKNINKKVEETEEQVERNTDTKLAAGQLSIENKYRQMNINARTKNVGLHAKKASFRSRINRKSIDALKNEIKMLQKYRDSFSENPSTVKRGPQKKPNKKIVKRHKKKKK